MRKVNSSETLFLESTVVSTPHDAYPNWNLLPSSDFLRMSNTDEVLKQPCEQLAQQQLL